MRINPSFAFASGLYFWAILTPGRNFERVFYEGRVLDLVPMENPFAVALSGSIVLIAEIVPRIPHWLNNAADSANPALDFIAWVKPAFERVATGLYRAVEAALSGAYKAGAAFVGAYTSRITQPAAPPIPTMRITGTQQNLAAALANTLGQSTAATSFVGGGAAPSPVPKSEPKASPTLSGAVSSGPKPPESAKTTNIPDSEFKLSPRTRDLIRPTRLRVAKSETGLVDPYVRRLGGGRAEANYLGFFFSGPEARVRTQIDEFAKEARVARVGWDLPNTLDLTPFVDKRKKSPAQAIKAYVADLDLRPNTLDETTVGARAPYPVDRIVSCGFIWEGNPIVLPYRELAAFVATARGARVGVKNLPEQIKLSANLSPLEALNDFLAAATGTRRRKEMF